MTRMSAFNNVIYIILKVIAMAIREKKKYKELKLEKKNYHCS